MRLVCLGDSITFGYGVEKKDSWVELLKEELSCDIINHGVNGATVFDMIYFFQENVVYEGATHLIVMGGINDLLMGRTAVTVADRIEDIILMCLDRSIDIKVATMIDPIEDAVKTGWVERDRLQKLIRECEEGNRRLREKCMTHRIECVDFSMLFSNQEEREGCFLDGIHPNERGHRLMFEYLRALYRR